MAQKVLHTWELAQFKSKFNVSALSIFKSRTTSKLYACDKTTGDFIGMLAADFDKTKPVVVIEMTDDESGETWKFIGNGEPREAEFELA